MYPYNLYCNAGLLLVVHSVAKVVHMLRYVDKVKYKSLFFRKRINQI